MFCSRCGAVLRDDGTVCQECGNSAAPAAAQAAETAVYAQTVRKLGLWFVLFATLNAGLGAAVLVNGLMDHGHFAGPIEP